MTEKTDTQQQEAKQQVLQAYSELIGRLNLANKMGVSYDGNRDLYSTLGYPRRVTFTEFYGKFRRQDMAKAIINRPVKATWRGELVLLEADDDKETPLEKAFKELEKEHRLKSKFIRVDRLTALGRYGVLLLGLDDVKKKDDAMLPVVPGKRKLKYVKALSEHSAQIVTWDTKPSSERYGLPVTYELTVQNPDDANTNISIKVHYSRIIHITGDKMESEVYGMPALEAVYNRLMDLEKLAGGSGEMFWRGARPGFGLGVKDDYTLPKGSKEEQAVQDQIAEYEHHLRRFLVLEGIDLKELKPQVVDPASHIDAQIQLISAETGIPKRILVGSERGELASSQDENAWKEMIQARRDEFATTEIFRPFVDRMIELGILPPPDDDYTIKWSDLFAQSDKEKAEVGKTRSEALKNYAAQPEAQYIMPPDAFLEFIMNLDENQIQLIKEIQEQNMIDEQRQMDEDEKALREMESDEVESEDVE